MSLLAMAFPSDAQPIRIGELNSYKAQAAFLEPYRKGWALALEEINAAGGLLGRPVEVGTTSLRAGRGIVVDHAYIDGKSVMPSDADVRKWRVNVE